MENHKKQLEIIEKRRIMDLYKRDYKIIEISNIYQINEKTVRRIIKKYKDHDTMNRKKGTGLKKKYNEDIIKDFLINIIKNNRALTLNEIKNKLKEDYKIEYSKSNIHKILKNIGYSKKNAKLIIHLTEKQLNDRQYWATFYNGFNWDL